MPESMQQSFSDKQIFMQCDNKYLTLSEVWATGQFLFTFIYFIKIMMRIVHQLIMINVPTLYCRVTGSIDANDVHIHVHFYINIYQHIPYYIVVYLKNRQ